MHCWCEHLPDMVQIDRVNNLTFPVRSVLNDPISCEFIDNVVVRIERECVTI